MARRTLILAGAPEASVVSLTSQKLLEDFLPTFRKAIDGTLPTSQESISRDASYSAWRSIPLYKVAEESSKGTYCKNGPDTNVEKAPGFLAAVNRPDEAEFLEHSFSLAEDISTALDGSPQGEDTTIANATSFISETNTSFSTSDGTNLSFSADLTGHDSATNQELIYLLNRVSLANLRDLPNASQLSRLYPQTVTPNLLAGIISISPPRGVTVRARRPGQQERQMEIVELLLGDDTAAGFAVTFWLPPEDDLKAETQAQQRERNDGKAIRMQLARLRRGDVVLLTNVALSTFKGKVYGQSLRRRGGAISTGVRVIPMVLEEEGIGGEGLEKLKRVRDWTMNFIGIETEKGRGKRKATNDRTGLNKKAKMGFVLEALPADTQ